MDIARNPPAFPFQYVETAHNGRECTMTHNGMDLRDWFAGRASVGLLAHPAGPAGDWAKAAKDAYAMADAMLAARAST